MESRESRSRVDELLPEAFATGGERVRIRIIGKKWALIELDGMRECVLRVALHALLERFDIHPNRFMQTGDAAIERREVRVGDAPQVVQRAVKIVCASIEVFVGPHAIDELLAVHHASRSERESGEHFDGATLLPSGRRNGSALDLDGKPAEQEDACGR